MQIYRHNDTQSVAVPIFYKIIAKSLDYLTFL